MAVGDVDGDGKVDVAVGSAYVGDVLLFHGVGDGTLGPITSRWLSGSPRSVVIADFNGDGQGDVAVGTRGPLDVFITENGSLPEHGVAYAAAGQSTESIAAGDVNGDGVTDLAGVDAGADVASVWPGNGDGAFATRLDFTTAHNPLALALGDLDRDGRLDLLTGSLNVVSGLLNNTALKPGTATGAASDVTQTTATLNGAINPRARQTQFRYEYGTSSAYEQSMGWHEAGAGDSPVLAPVSIGGLQPGTQYHYRLVANNAAGHAEGQDRTFTTASAPPPSVDLALSISGPDSVHEGDEISYRLTVANNGPDAARGVVVTDPLPDGAGFVTSKSSSSCTEAAETVTCQVPGSVANGSQVAVDSRPGPVTRTS